MFACDGGHSRVVEQLQIPFVKKPSGTVTRSMVVKADLSKACATRAKANLHWVLQPEEECEPWAFMTCFRMVKPWNEYVSRELKIQLS